MAEAVVLKAQKRTEPGTRSARKSRQKGFLPVIIYGHKETPVSAQVNYHDLILELQHHRRLLDVDLEGSRVKLLVKEVQYDHLCDKVVHVDLMRVSLDERVKVDVRVELRGTPAGAVDGGILEQIQPTVELECLVTSIPENIRVSVAELKVGDNLLASQLDLPAGAKLVTLPDTVIATVRVMAEEAAAAPAVESEAVEPEVIVTREKPEESEEEKG